MALKTYVEILITPIVIAVIGIVGTISITNTQVKNASEIAETQIRIQIREAENNKKLKALEIFSKQIMSKDPEERRLALGLINILDSELASKMLSYLAEFDPDVGVKNKAKHLQNKYQFEAKPLGYQDIEERVKRVVAKKYDIPYSQINNESVLDSLNPNKNVAMVGDLTSIEVLIELEETFSCNVKDEIAMEIETVKDVVDVFKSCVTR